VRRRDRLPLSQRSHLTGMHGTGIGDAISSVRAAIVISKCPGAARVPGRSRTLASLRGRDATSMLRHSPGQQRASGRPRSHCKLLPACLDSCDASLLPILIGPSRGVNWIVGVMSSRRVCSGQAIVGAGARTISLFSGHRLHRGLSTAIPCYLTIAGQGSARSNWHGWRGNTVRNYLR
jgi:hypothetical protein